MYLAFNLVSSDSSFVIPICFLLLVVYLFVLVSTIRKTKFKVFGDPKQISGKLVNIKLHIRRSQRVVKGSRSICTCECRSPNSTTPGHLS